MNEREDRIHEIADRLCSLGEIIKSLADNHMVLFDEKIEEKLIFRIIKMVKVYIEELDELIH